MATIALVAVGILLWLFGLSGNENQPNIDVSVPTAPTTPTAPPSAAGAPETPETPDSAETPVPEVVEPEPFQLEVPDEYFDLVEILLQAGVAEPSIGDLLQLALTDGMGDGIFSSSMYEPGNFGDDVDQWDVMLIGSEATQAILDTLFNNSVFECGTDLDGSITVCLSSPALDMDAGELLIAVEVLSGPVASENWLYTYATVFDRDGDPANNFVPVAPYDWDYFGGTDSWYVLDYAGGEWSGGLFWGGFDNPRPTAARAVIRGNTIVWFIPRQEVPEADGARTTSFRHDGSFQPTVSGGDVFGATPLDPMIPVSQLDLDFEPAGDSLADGESLVRQFVADFDQAQTNSDGDFLFRTLDTAVLDRYGTDQCATYVAATAGTVSNFHIDRIVGPVEFTYLTDGLETEIPGSVYGTDMRFEIDGAPTELNINYHVADGEVRWFTDCGDPIN